MSPVKRLFTIPKKWKSWSWGPEKIIFLIQHLCVLKPKIIDEHSYSSQDIKLAVMEMPRLSQMLIGIGKPYDKLLLAILSIDRESNERLLTDKKMIQELSIKPHFFRKCPHQLYDDLLELLGDENKPQMVISEGERHISWQRWSKSFDFVTKLPVTPRFGDTFDLHFFRPIDSLNWYHVSRTTHTIKENKQVIYITLRTGFHNSYTVFLDDKEESDAYGKGHWYWKDWMEKRKNA